MDSVSSRDTEAFCQERGNARGDLGPFLRGPQRWNLSNREGRSEFHQSQNRSPFLGQVVPGREVGLRRLEGRVDSPCRAGMAFHTDTGPWLANWPSDTSRKKMGNPASASIIR